MRIGTAMLTRLAATVICATTCAVAVGAQGEMGTGVPTGYNIYTATGASTVVWGLGNVSILFPSGCSSITLTPATMGVDGYKIAIATLHMSKLSNLPVRFYSHAVRDSGCGVDMIQLSP